MFCDYDFKTMRTVKCDTVVIGGGLGGACAAIASGRGGASTILVEADGVLGGQAGIGLVTPMSSCESRNGKSFGGLVKEITDSVSLLTKKYVCSDPKENNISTISPQMTEYVLLKMALEAGVEVRFHTVLCDAETETGRILSVVLLDKSGFLRIVAKNYIDASGDADLVFLSGDKYVLGSEKGVFNSFFETEFQIDGIDERSKKYNYEGLMQPTSLFFILRGVDYEKASNFNNKNISFGDLGITKEKFEKWCFAGTPGFEITSNRVPMPQNRILVSHGRHKDEAVVNMSMVININGASADDLSKGEIIARLQLIAIIDFLKTFIPGFENCYLVDTSSHLGVRESRRLIGKYVLTGKDVITCRHFDDAVCKAYYIIDIHDPSGNGKAIGGKIKGDYFEIPFGSLCSSVYSNLLVCGRCISSDHIAHSASRIQGTCILTGQAVGTAAAISIRDGIHACEVSTERLRKIRCDDGVGLKE